MSAIEAPNFQEMSIAKLREYAAHMRVALPKTATKDDIVSALNNKINGRNVVMLAEKGSTCPPGHARITVHENATPGSSNMPVFVFGNGYTATIPRGIEVIVPRKVVRILGDSKVRKRKQIVDPNSSDGRPKEQIVIAPQYPFTVHEQTPGPEPLTALEQSKKKTQMARKKYRAIFQRWPRPGELTRAIEKGLIDLSPDDELPAHEAMILGQAIESGETPEAQ